MCHCFSSVAFFFIPRVCLSWFFLFYLIVSFPVYLIFLSLATLTCVSLWRLFFCFILTFCSPVSCYLSLSFPRDYLHLFLMCSIQYQFYLHSAFESCLLTVTVSHQVTTLKLTCFLYDRPMTQLYIHKLHSREPHDGHWWSVKTKMLRVVS